MAVTRNVNTTPPGTHYLNYLYYYTITLQVLMFRISFNLAIVNSVGTLTLPLTIANYNSELLESFHQDAPSAGSLAA